MLIQRALVVGFSLAELQRVLGIRDGGGAPCRQVRTLVGQRFEELNGRIAQLLALRDELGLLMSEWDKRLEKTPTASALTCSTRWERLLTIERNRRTRYSRPAGRTKAVSTAEEEARVYSQRVAVGRGLGIISSRIAACQAKAAKTTADCAMSFSPTRSKVSMLV